MWQVRHIDLLERRNTFTWPGLPTDPTARILKKQARTCVRRSWLRSTRIIIVPVEIAHNRCVVVRINCTSSSTFSVCARIRALIYQIWRVEVGKEQLFGSCLRASVARVRRKKKGNHPWPCNGVTACVSDAWCLSKIGNVPKCTHHFLWKGVQYNTASSLRAYFCHSCCCYWLSIGAS